MAIKAEDDICVCGHSRAKHGGLDGHGACKHSYCVAGFRGVFMCECPLFTWHHTEEGGRGE